MISDHHAMFAASGQGLIEVGDMLRIWVQTR
jgi:hypothetical protein